jgi:uncharacterized protein DUF6951
VTRVEVNPGICGLRTIIEVEASESDPFLIRLRVESACNEVAKLGKKLGTVQALREISYRGDGPSILQAAAKNLKHPACVVPAAILKAIEVEAGLALPGDVMIAFVQK